MPVLVVMTSGDGFLKANRYSNFNWQSKCIYTRKFVLNHFLVSSHEKLTNENNIKTLLT